MAYAYVFHYQMKLVISWPNIKIQKWVVSAGHVLLYNIQLFGIAKTEMKKAAITTVHVLVTLVGKGHLKLLLILVKFLFLLESCSSSFS